MGYFASLYNDLVISKDSNDGLRQCRETIFTNYLLCIQTTQTIIIYVTFTCKEHNEDLAKFYILKY